MSEGGNIKRGKVNYEVGREWRFGTWREEGRGCSGMKDGEEKRKTMRRGRHRKKKPMGVREIGCDKEMNLYTKKIVVMGVEGGENRVRRVRHEERNKSKIKRKRIGVIKGEEMFLWTRQDIES